MPAASFPPNELERLQALWQFDILDTPPESTFDRITALATRLFDVPIALISLVDMSRQWYESCQGIVAQEHSRRVSFCAYAIHGEHVFVIPDVQDDPRFQDNDLVNGEPHIRFYAGAPIRTRDGYNLGTLCLIDQTPRSFSVTDQQNLLDLAAIVCNEMELRLADSARKQAEAKYRNIVEHASEGIFQTTPNGTILMANPALVRMFGYASELEFIESFPLERQYLIVNRRAELLQQMQEQGVIMEFESQVYHREGYLFWISENVHSVRDHEGKVLYYEGSIQNITGRKQAERQYIALEAAELRMHELQKLNRLKDDFLSTVSHELRTPMSNIRMAITLLKSSTSQEKQGKFLQMLEQQCDREIELINNLLDLQSLEGNMTSLVMDWIDLPQWLSKQLLPFEYQTQTREQIITLEISSKVNIVFSHAVTLARIINELLNNACKYAPQGGTIQVCVQPMTCEAIQLKVANNSPDLAQEDLAHVFDKFYRIPNADPWSHSGVGLGLALVKKLVEQLGGTIEAISALGIVTFSVVLPITQDTRYCEKEISPTQRRSS